MVILQQITVILLFKLAGASVFFWRYGIIHQELGYSLLIPMIGGKSIFNFFVKYGYTL